MRFSTWNWPTHPWDKTRGVVIGPFFGVVCAISVPVVKGRYGLTVRFSRFGAGMKRTVRHFADGFVD